MPDFNIRDEYMKLIKIISEKNNISQDEVVETAVAMFLKMYFMRYDMYPELQIVQRESGCQEMDAEQIKEKIENDKTMVDTAIAEAQRLGLI
ncbi:MAG: hypothetical protein A4E52_01142 [Pelotomaculum sp. PtaB.Bin013]|uniref:Uncharacterized protein n=1 Tax=Pelotomaculum isophthalicicum JI TaxID=947010 RepID=A0A9X4H1G4_9FIRM|nr:hypothetical protein [Pelotomaculum isophthalicicum]MDF9408070.1 hypothetical protein [Pelotomaculum isophthalicicum JI]OPX88947.1 MAG: hypothetical protein A4E52_01142 [Pelotomaculum sp. PtaB.Bin013]